jgi:hypothetical protein
VLARPTQFKFELSFHHNTCSFLPPLTCIQIIDRSLLLPQICIETNRAATLLDLRLRRLHAISLTASGDGVPCLVSRVLLHPADDAILTADRFGGLVGLCILFVAISFTLRSRFVLWHDAVFVF